MKEFDDPLDLLSDDDDGVIEMSIFEEKEKHISGRGSSKSSCSVVILLPGSSLLIAGWGVSRQA
jgi:hypothetical protein